MSVRPSVRRRLHASLNSRRRTVGRPFPYILLCTVTALVCASCGGSASLPGSTPEIRLTLAGDPSAAIELRGLPSDAIAALKRAQWSDAQWAQLFRVEVADGATAAVPAVAGSYGIRDGLVVFTPMFGLDSGVQYRATFDPAVLPDNARWSGASRVVTAVGRPRGDTTPTTSISAVYPSGDDVPENLLRLYIHFSGPMSRQGGIGYVHVLDEKGREVKAPFLPLEAELWNADRTRFTVFLDPGRVKRGILPNEMMGRALEAGRRYTLVVDREWVDAKGLPLTETFRKSFRAGPPDTRPIEPAKWSLQSPRAGTRDPLTVTFPKPLDRGLMLRALGVRKNAATLQGDQQVSAGETMWSFVPAEPWIAGTYELIALSILEDAAGNRVGRAFEVDEFERTDPVKPDASDTVSLPFTVVSR